MGPRPQPRLTGAEALSILRRKFTAHEITRIVHGEFRRVGLEPVADRSSVWNSRLPHRQIGVHAAVHLPGDQALGREG